MTSEDAKLDKEVADVDKKADSDEPDAKPTIEVKPKTVKVMPLTKRLGQSYKVFHSWLMSEPEGPIFDDFSDCEKEEEVTDEQCKGTEPVMDIQLKDVLWDKLTDMINFTVDPGGNLYYYWSAIMTLYCFYNLILIIARTAFDEFQQFWRTWLIIDFVADFLFLIDMIISSRKIYLEHGSTITEPRQLFRRYRSSLPCLLDIISVFPTEILYIWFPMSPWVRFNRLMRCYRFSDFIDRTEMRTGWPNMFRVFKLLATIFTMFHWNACLFFELSKYYGTNEPGRGKWQFQYEKIRQFVMPNCDPLEDVDGCTALFDVDADIGNALNLTQHDRDSYLYEHWTNNSRTMVFSNLTRQYVFSLYWSALILTTIGEQNPPINHSQFIFVIADILLGLLIFATIVGNVGEMVTNMNAAKAAFEEQMDGVKQYMVHRKVNPKLQKRILKWFRYIWTQGQTLDEDQIVEQLPPKLQAEIAMTLHLNTLKKVRLFQDCEPGLLVELVQKLKLQVFSPGDYICRRGDVGKEMYIVKRGSLNVVAPDGIKVFVTLKEGAVFGELSIMDIAGNKNGNRRTAGVRSVGFSDLFVLTKDDLWDALREYPEGKRSLLQKGRDILKKDNILDESAPQLETGPTKTVEQKLDFTEVQLNHMSENIDQLYKRFAEETQKNKQRVAKLEKELKEKRERMNDKK